MDPELRHLLSLKLLSPLDVRFAEVVATLSGEDAPVVRLAAALASRAVSRGHVCVDLAAIAHRPLLDDEGQGVLTPLPGLSDWLAALHESPLVETRPAWTLDGARPSSCPLVLVMSRLYLNRYYRYEQRLGHELAARREPLLSAPPFIRGLLDRLFPGATGEDDQRTAVAVAALKPLTVLSGGPGTGKTSTLVRILAVLQTIALSERGRPDQVLLVAPTGKAAQRMSESIRAQIASLDIEPDVRDAIPHEATTIHRALGYRRRTPTRFHFHREHPLPADVVVADEASMIDLALMTKLVEAVPQPSRLILIGDRDQLASVEAGSVLGDLYPATVRDAAIHPSVALASALRELTPLSPPAEEAPPAPMGDCIVQLRRSYRYGEHSGIGALARAIREGDAGRSLAVLAGDETMPYGEVALHPFIGAGLEDDLLRLVEAGYRPLTDPHRAPGDRLAQLRRFRILCAHRRGPSGSTALNQRVLDHLAPAGTQPDGLYDGRPIMVTKNDHQQGLFNGDVGLVVRAGERWVAAFSTSEGTTTIPASRLPPFETAYAMTVHKSQGSEFDRVAVVLPEVPSPILSRELVYTAVTRAREKADIFGDEVVLRRAIRTAVERASGLRMILAPS